MMGMRCSQRVERCRRRLVGLGLLVLMSLPAAALEVRFDPYRLWQGLEGWSDGENAVMFDLAVDVPLAVSMWGPTVSFYGAEAGSYQTLGVQWTRMLERESGFYYGGGMYWLSITPDSAFEGEMADVCRPLVPVGANGRWGYRWQFNPVFNVQFGASVALAQVTSRQAERCVTDGAEVDFGPVQNIVDPRIDFKFSFRL